MYSGLKARLEAHFCALRNKAATSAETSHVAERPPRAMKQNQCAI